ncbi:unnamed protein product [Cuscuta campestris]|uniref:Uncharacterized protein n=1 Tax=Cuscuta campestris TaxID=132261 RepID=A0A484KV06_9ASTE|nr:unnamed protein product [Cuscuta campestris]
MECVAGSSARAVGSNNVNEHSSRSHWIKSSLNRLTSQVKSYSIDFLVVIEPIVAPNKLDSYMFKLGFTNSRDVLNNKIIMVTTASRIEGLYSLDSMLDVIEGTNN